MANLNVFQRELERKKQAFLAGELEARKELLSEVNYRLIERCPRDTGYTASQINVGLERNDTRTDNPIGTQAAIQRNNATIERMTSLMTRVFFTLAVKWANRLEHGWSQQAPAGFFGLTLAEFPELARRAYGRIGTKAGLRKV